MPVDPGAHVVTASAAGRKTWTKRLEVPTAKNIAVEVPVLETDAAASAPVVRKPPPRKEGPLLPPPPESGPEPMKIAGYVATGVGVVGLAIGTITGLAALGKRSDAENKCESYPSRCSAEGSAANDDAKKFATISTISLIAGGVLVAGGLVLILTSPKKADVQASRPLLLGGTF